MENPNQTDKTDEQFIGKYVKKLAEGRAVLAARRERIKAMEQEFAESEAGRMLAQAREDVANVAANVSELEDTIRKSCMEFYGYTGEKQQHPALTVKLFTVLYYDEAVALDYARAHIPNAVKLDKKTFEKVAPALGLDFVTVRQEPRCQIATDLTPWLEE